MSNHYGWRCARCRRPLGNLTRTFCRCGALTCTASWAAIAAWELQPNAYPRTA